MIVTLPSAREWEVLSCEVAAEQDASKKKLKSVFFTKRFNTDKNSKKKKRGVRKELQRR